MLENAGDQVVINFNFVSDYKLSFFLVDNWNLDVHPISGLCCVDICFFMTMFYSFGWRAFHSTICEIYFSQDESVLARIRTDQRMARREGWMDNLAATLMGSRPVRKRSTTLVIRYLLIKVDILLVVSINFP